MKDHIRPAIIGGTGKSGKYLVRALIAQGIPFKMLVRNPDHISQQSRYAEIVYGNVLDPGSVRELFTGCNAVISTLGMGIPPGKPDLFSQVTENILHTLQTAGIRRYISTTGLNVDTPEDRKGEASKAATAWMYSHFPASTADKQKEHALLAASDTDWTQVRLPKIEETDRRSDIAVSLEDCPGDGISAANLAHFLISQLEDRQYVQKAPFIADRL